MSRFVLLSAMLVGVGLVHLPCPSGSRAAGDLLAREDRAPACSAAPGDAPHEHRPHGPAARAAAVQAALTSLPLHFVENRGLDPANVAYTVDGADKSLFFAPGGITFRLKGEDQAWVVKLDFVGANPDVAPQGEDRQQAIVSYFRGPRRDWKTGLRTFARIVYRALWPGIDLVYSGTANELKYEFVVAPGADPAQIQLRYRGAESVEVTAASSLKVTTPAGSFEDAAPVAWQEIDSQRVSVAMAYRLDPEAGKEVEFGFDLGAYDPAHPLVLDPAVLLYCGYVGGSGADVSQSIAVDGTGNAYITGYTGSTEQTFPVAVGPDLTHNGGDDGFVAKVNAAGTALLYCGYIGGSGTDYGIAIAVDGAGNAYVTGRTDSTEQTFPVTVGPDLTHNGGLDAFVAKVNAAGTALLYCGYIGGSGTEYGGIDIAVDAAGNAFVSGQTASTEQTFPVTVGPDLTHNGGYDAFVAKVNPAGTALLYCGYLGGSGYERGFGIAVDAAGSVWTSGYTSSTEQTFPVTVGPDLTHNGGYDAFVAKVDAAGTALLYCGYLGGTGTEYGYGIAVDAAGNAYLTGRTTSTEQTFPVTVGPDLTHNGGDDAFVTKVNAQGTGLDYCGYLGGSGADYGYGIAVDALGNACVTGYTSSDEQTFPVVVGPDLTHNGGVDGFVARVAAPGTGLLSCGYLGGSGTDYGKEIAVDAAGNAYVIAQTASDEQTFPVVVGPDLTHNGGDDVVVAKITGACFLAGGGAPTPGGQVNLALSSSADGGLVYQLGSSFGSGPIAIDTRRLELSPDALFFLSVLGAAPGVFQNYLGVLDGQGQAAARLAIPGLPSLKGIRVYTAFVTLKATAPSGVANLSNTFLFTIQ
ncbi:MAG: SBBP repeat-containing protein [Planctomycetes bacterium]|nr:SBBP repeat-containing protein [Planctomycetota bacterium]